MPRVTVPEGKDPLVHVWTELAPPLTAAAGAYSTAVYEKSSLSLREFEAARITIARINQCAICIDWRTARDVPGRAEDPDAIPEAFYRQVGVDRQWDQLTEREQLCAEFAERYAADHLEHGRCLLGGSPPPSLQRRRTASILALCVGSWLWPWAGSTRSSTSTAPVGCLRYTPLRHRTVGPIVDGEGHRTCCGAPAAASPGTPCRTAC